jgi:opacity protein-like surface antigen
MTRVRALLLFLAPVFPLVSVDVRAELAPYVRFGTGFEWSDDTVVRDRDCGSTQPPALFGCVAGNDGRPIGARGDFGRSAVWELGAGVELTSRLRAELAVAQRDGFELEAEANFVGVQGAQPVRAEAGSRSAMIAIAYDLAPVTLRVRPVVSAGAGIARNEMGRATYSFPGIAPDAVTILAGGSDTALAWMASTGVAIDLSHALTLDIALRYANFGEITTEHGEATIIRPNRTLTLDIAGVRAPLETLGVAMALRWRL